MDTYSSFSSVRLQLDDFITFLHHCTNKVHGTLETSKVFPKFFFVNIRSTASLALQQSVWCLQYGTKCQHCKVFQAMITCMK